MNNNRRRSYRGRQQKSNFRFRPFGLGDTTNVWACNSEDIYYVLHISFIFSISISAKTIAQESGTEVEFSNLEF